MQDIKRLKALELENARLKKLLAQRDSAGKSSSVRILIADDHALVREGLRKMIENRPSAHRAR